MDNGWLLVTEVFELDLGVGRSQDTNAVTTRPKSNSLRTLIEFNMASDIWLRTAQLLKETTPTALPRLVIMIKHIVTAWCQECYYEKKVYGSKTGINDRPTAHEQGAYTTEPQMRTYNW